MASAVAWPAQRRGRRGGRRARRAAFAAGLGAPATLELGHGPPRRRRPWRVRWGPPLPQAWSSAWLFQASAPPLAQAWKTCLGFAPASGGEEEFPMGSVEGRSSRWAAWRRTRRSGGAGAGGPHRPKKLRLSKEQSRLLEESFRLNHTLTPLAGTRSAAAWARATGRGLGRERPLRRCPDEPRRQPELRPRRRRGRFLPVLAGGGGGGAAAGGAAWPHVGDEAAELTDGSHVNRGLSC
ncbi:uncharacterized protein LOC120666709 isoform X1 [Panicum virgatum]|uniref:uncharacterized protein LOC120666709 isoform X1 n=1 Tax=Panicum virgatum TaxID=38727 RepID=UPI0019D646CC|nr:uncharacterized protein LOC120666709 isoform X1 [Panicum virgatum]